MKKSKKIKQLTKSLANSSALVFFRNIRITELCRRVIFLEHRNKQLEDTLAKVRKDIEQQADSMIKDTETLKKELARAMELLDASWNIGNAIEAKKVIEKVYNAI
jgi:Mg2+ and Co2+ transporter CorA